MPSAATAVAFSAAVAVLMLVPGPAMVYVVTVSADRGRRAGLASVAGICLGDLVLVVMAAAGLTVALATSPAALTTVRVAGAAYLACLGVRRLLRRVLPLPPAGPADRVSAAASGHVRRAVVQGFVVGVLNPKDALFFLAFLPQFVDPARGSTVGQLLLLGSFFVVAAAVFDGAYALIGARLGTALRRRPRLWAGQRWAVGGTYLALGALAVFDSFAQ